LSIETGRVTPSEGITLQQAVSALEAAAKEATSLIPVSVAIVDYATNLKVSS
jgi:uncharacterized protein GlcG (DUF336 family)